MIKTGDDQTPDHHQYKTKYERCLIYNKILFFDHMKGGFEIREHSQKFNFEAPASARYWLHSFYFRFILSIYVWRSYKTIFIS